jgi:transporter family protein
MSWFIFALLAASSWGVGQVLIKKGFEHTSPLFNNLLGTIFGCLIFIPFSLIGGVNWSLLPKILILAFLAAAPNMLYYYAAEKGEISLTGTLLATYPLFTILLSRLFLAEQTDIFQKLAILSIIAGSFLISKPNKFSFKLEPWVIWGIISAVIIGFGDFMGKVSLTKSDIYTFMLAFSISYVITMILNFLLDKKGRKFPRITERKLLPTLSGTFLMEVGVLFLYLGFNVGKASLVSPISSSYVVLTVILAVLFLKEKISRTQLMGVILAAVGIVLIGI